MKLPFKLSALVLFAPLALVPLGCDGGGDGGDEAADTTDNTDTTDGTDTGEPDPVAGQMIHDSTCAVVGCHSAADMVQLSERVPMMDDAMITNQIRMGGTGPEGTMPAFNENQIDAQQLADLIAYLRQEFGGPP